MSILLLLWIIFAASMHPQPEHIRQDYEHPAQGSQVPEPSTFEERKKHVLLYFRNEMDAFEEQFYSKNFSLPQQLNGRKAADMAQISFQLNYKTAFGNELIRNIAKMQITDKAHPYYGNFRKTIQFGNDFDQNYATFILPALSYIYRNHQALLDDDVKPLLEQVLKRGHHAVLFMKNERIPVWYANVYLKVIATLIMLGDEAEALDATREFYAFTKQFGLNEYGQWNYVALQISALHLAYENATNPELKQKLHEILELHWFDTIHHIHEPTMMYAFTSSRAKGSKGLKPGSRLNTLLYLYLGRGNASGAFSGPQLLLADYQLPGHVKALYEEISVLDEFSYQAKYGRVDMQTFRTQDYSLSTQSGRRSTLGRYDKGKALLSSEENEISVQINSPHPATPGIRFKINSPRSNFDHYWITSIQEKNKGIISYNFDLEGIELHKNQEISSSVEFGDASKITAIYVDGAEWDGSNTKLSTNNALVVQLGSLLMGIRFLESDVAEITGHPIADTQNSVVLSKVNNAVWLKNYFYYNADIQAVKKFTPHDYGKRMGYVIRIESTTDYSVAAFIEAFSLTQVRQQLQDDVHSVKVEFEDGTTLSLEENLKSDMILSRTVDGNEFDNAYLLHSAYVSYKAGEYLQEREFDPTGTLARPVTNSRDVSAPNITLKAADFFVYSPHVDDNELYRNAGITRNTTTISHQEENGERFLKCDETGGRAYAGFNIPQGGSWHVWLKVYAEENSAASLAINSPLRHYFPNHNSGYPPVTFTTKNNGGWQWLKAEHVYFMAQGSHTLGIRCENAGMQISDVVLTTNPNN